MSIAYASSDLPFWTEKSSWFSDDYLYVVGIASGADSSEKGRTQALVNAKNEILATMQLSDFQGVEIITERTVEEKRPDGKVDVWRLCKINVEQLQRTATYEFPNVTQETYDAPKIESLTERKIAPEFGRLSIVSAPAGATVYLDAQVVGTTPLLIQKALVGERNLTLEKKGYEDSTQDVPVRKDKLEIVMVALKQQSGDLAIESEPTGAEIFVNRIKRGISPIVLPKLPIGKYEIVARHGGHTDAFDQAEVRYNRRTEIKLSLQPEPGALLVKSDPSGATVYIDGELKGITTLSIEPVSAGRRQVKIEHDGYVPYVGEVVIKPNKAETVSVVLNEGVKDNTNGKAVGRSWFARRFIDLEVGYQNDHIRFIEPGGQTVNSLDGAYLGLDFFDVLSASINTAWKTVEGRPDQLASIDNEGVEVALKLPYDLTERLTVYLGGGYRYGLVAFYDSDDDEVRPDIHNSSGLLTAGVKFWGLFARDARVGLNISCTRTIGAQFANSTLLRLGVLIGVRAGAFIP